MLLWRIKSDGVSKTHYDSCINDTTLCGFTTDGDEMVAESYEQVEGKRATCGTCNRIVEYCRALPRPRTRKQEDK